MKKGIVLFLMSWCLTFGVRADEGMWLLPYLSKLNINDMKAKGLKLSAEDIYRLNGDALKDAIVIFGQGCTAEVISDKGLILTNHHCGFGAIQQHSSVSHDYLKNGFWAMSDQEEIPTPGLTVTFIRRIEDVSEQILAGLSDSLSEEERSKQVVQAIGRVKSQVQLERSGQEIEIKDFFGGNQYLMFIRESYPDVRLVGAPPSSIGKFGGDTDNWMWPRQTGDFALFRIYSDSLGAPVPYSVENVPYKAPVHLKISLKGYKPGDFTMVLGFPGMTQRYSTSYEVDYKMNVVNPIVILIRGIRQELMMEDMLADDQVQIQYASKYSNSSNYWKNFIGENVSLKRQHVIAKKVADQQRFMAWVEADPLRQARYAEALPLIREWMEKTSAVNRQIRYYTEALGYGMEILTAASLAAPLIDRTDAFDSLKLESVTQKMAAFYKNYSPSMDRKIARRMLSILRDSIAKKELPVCLEEIDTEYGGDIGAYVDHLYDHSMFGSQERVEAFLQHPDVKVLARDPVYKMQQEVLKQLDKLMKLGNAFQAQLMRGRRLFIAGLMEMDSSRVLYPDANFTLRLSYGQVLPYRPQDGVLYDYYTTLKGVMQKEDTSRAYEFAVPEKLKQLYQEKDYGPYGEHGVMYVNFITTNDITGGNSGSPVLNGKGELIGVAFDGNWEAISGSMIFEPDLQRTICVDIRYILFIIDKYAGDVRLIDEMTIIR